MWPQGRSVFTGLILLAGVGGGCRADEDKVDPLVAVLARETSQALAAARMGPAGGSLEVASGELQGVGIAVPPGALGGDAVISIYAGAPITADTGYAAVGPSAEFRATVAKLLLDATVTLPFIPEQITAGTPQQRVLVLLGADGAVETVAGTNIKAERVAAPTKVFATFGAAIDPAWVNNRSDQGVELRCERLSGGTTLKTAINGTRLAAMGMMTDATVFTARSYNANGCGFSLGWEVVWYSEWLGRYEVYSYWATGATLTDTVLSLPCAPQPYAGVADSTGLSDDFAERWGGTPQTLLVEVRNCNASPAQLPPRVRLSAGTGNWVEYNQDGGFAAQNF